MKAVYPVVLTPDEPGYVVDVPDLDISTEGGSLAEALEMARDAISLWGICQQDEGRNIPEPASLTPPHEPGQIVSLVDVDFDAARRATENRAVRKNVTIPSWLNDIAERNGANFSALLQNAIKQQYHVQDR